MGYSHHGDISKVHDTYHFWYERYHLLVGNAVDHPDRKAAIYIDHAEIRLAAVKTVTGQMMNLEGGSVSCHRKNYQVASQRDCSKLDDHVHFSIVL